MVKIMNVSKETDKLEVRKRINKLISSARKNAKPKVCELCGKEKTSFCNSHSVPQMSLKCIADNGKLLHASALMGFDSEIVDLENGVNKSGTFNYICRECDNSFFKDYETPDSLLTTPTDKVLSEIAVKNMIQFMSKRAIEKELIKIQQKKFATFINPQEALDLKELDFNEFEQEVLFHKNIADNNLKGGYQIICHEILPYIVPIAMQSAIAMVKDYKGNQINNVFDFRNTTRMQYLHICVFPLERQSVILVFYHKRDKLYRSLRHQLNSLSLDEKLKYFNYLIFEYTENYFISKNIQKEVETNDKLKLLSCENNGMPDFGMFNFNNIFGVNYKQVSMNDIPNFLSSEWAIQ